MKALFTCVALSAALLTSSVIVGHAEDSKSSAGVNSDKGKPGMAKEGGGKVEGPSHANGKQDMDPADKSKK